MADVRAPLFHIGFHKTATTWLQKAVWPNSTSHRFVRRRIARQALLAPRGLSFEAEVARSLLDQDGDGRPILVSEENLSGYIHTGGLHGLMAPEVARRIKACYPNAQILIGIRSQFDVLRASYAQYVKGGGTLPLDSYVFGDHARERALRHDFKNPTFSLAHFDYDRLVRLYEELFGGDNVHILLYERVQNDADMELDWITTECGVDLTREEINSVRQNVSLNLKVIGFLKWANYFRKGWVVDKRLLFNFPGSERLFKLLTALAQALPEFRPERPFTDAQRAAIVEAYSDGNRRLAERRNLPLVELGYPV